MIRNLELYSSRFQVAVFAAVLVLIGAKASDGRTTMRGDHSPPQTPTVSASPFTEILSAGKDYTFRQGVVISSFTFGTTPRIGDEHVCQAIVIQSKATGYPEASIALSMDNGRTIPLPLTVSEDTKIRSACSVGSSNKHATDLLIQGTGIGRGDPSYLVIIPSGQWRSLPFDVAITSIALSSNSGTGADCAAVQIITADGTRFRMNLGLGWTIPTLSSAGQIPPLYLHAHTRLTAVPCRNVDGTVSPSDDLLLSGKKLGIDSATVLRRSP